MLQANSWAVGPLSIKLVHSAGNVFKLLTRAGHATLETDAASLIVHALLPAWLSIQSACTALGFDAAVPAEAAVKP